MATKAVIYLYEIDDDPNTYQWGYRTKVIDLLISELHCVINDQGNSFKSEDYQVKECKTIDIMLNDDMENRIRNAIRLNGRRRKSMLSRLLFEIYNDHIINKIM